MTDTSVRSDLVRMAILMSLIIGILIGLKIYDQKTDQIGIFATKIYTKVFQNK